MKPSCSISRDDGFSKTMMASTSKSLAQINKSLDVGRATKEGSALRDAERIPSVIGMDKGVKDVPNTPGLFLLGSGIFLPSSAFIVRSFSWCRSP